MLNNFRIGVVEKKLFTTTFLFALLVTGIAWLLQSALSQYELTRAREAAAVELIDQMVPNVARAAWRLNDDVMLTLLSTLSNQPDILWSAFNGQLQHLTVPPMTRPEFQKQLESCERVIEQDLSGAKVGKETLNEGLLRVCYRNVSPVAGQLWSLSGSLLLQIISMAILSFGFVGLARRFIFQRLQSLSSILGTSVHDSFPLPEQHDQPPARDEFEAIESELSSKTQMLLGEQSLNRAIYLNIMDGLVIADEQFIIKRTNMVFAAMLNQAVSRLEGKSLKSLLPAACFLKKDSWQELKLPDGKIVSFYLSTFGVQDLFSGYLLFSRDLTDERRKELEIQHAQKMAAIGSISGGVAHDFNNFLAVIMGNTELAMLDGNLDEAQSKRLSAIRHSAQRGIALVDQLLTFSRKQDLRNERVIPGSAVFGACELARRALSPNITLEQSIASRSTVQTDPSYLESALLNLIINAGDAMPEGGTVEVSAYDEQRNNEPWVVFSVEDNGSGIAPDIIERVKEPFFTTKETGKGTGLGLSMVSGYAEQSGGSLEIQSSPQRTRAQIFLPAFDYSSEQPRSATRPPAARIQTQEPLSILIIDDEKLMREVVRDQLQLLGHTVTTLTSLHDVVHGGDLARFDLVYCDIVLEKETGDSILAYFRDKGLGTAFVFMSGNVPDRIHQSVQASDALYLLRKPFVLEDLLATLELYREHRKRVEDNTPTVGLSEQGLEIASCEGHKGDTRRGENRHS